MLQNRQAGDHHEHNNTQSSRPQVTLSGLLNAIDGLLSCCGDERIIVFTTNYKDRIDPALLRAGRMDMHIYLSYCTFSTFKQLAANYLDIWDHHLFTSIEKLIKEVQVSPADVAGELMKNRDPKTSLEGLVKFLEDKKSEAKLQKPEIKSDDNKSLEQKVDDNAFEIKKEAESPKDQSISLKEKKYRVKGEFEPVLEAILSKYGDIAANCSLRSVQCRSSLLEIVCDISQKLQAAKLKNLTENQQETLLNSVRDLESLRLEVGWLRQRLEEIQEMKEMDKQLKGSNGEGNGKLNCFNSKSLVDGLI
ncbi:hypothetical protein JCGZ_06513 [Jatropha curcas]|uniref:Uncharacterized protein n=2 Tax=Jatropha curcas TaxID=180498 RepID=A0A067LPE0_JATCU|nr:hypothetical protein JCGZ_06513 [Jatropha curcas]